MLGTLWKSSRVVHRTRICAARAGCSAETGSVPDTTAAHAAFRLAATLRDQADLIRGRATHLGMAGAAVRWRSPVTTAFHHRLEDSIGTLRSVAAHYDAAAEQITTMALYG